MRISLAILLSASCAWAGFVCGQNDAWLLGVKTGEANAYFEAQGLSVYHNGVKETGEEE